MHPTDQIYYCTANSFKQFDCLLVDRISNETAGSDCVYNTIMHTRIPFISLELLFWR